MSNKKSNFIIKALILGIPVAATLLSPTSKSEAMLKNTATGALRTGKMLMTLPKLNTSSVKTTSDSGIKFKSLATSSSSTTGASTSAGNPVKPPGSSIQALIQGLNKNTSSTNSSSSGPSNPTGKLNLNSEFRNKLSGLLGSGGPNLDKSKVKTTSSVSVGKLSSSSGSSLESIFGNKTSSTSSNNGSVDAYVNPDAPAAPPLSLTNTLSPTPSKIPDAPPLPPTKTQNQPSLQPVIKKSSSSTTNPLSNSNRTSIKPQGGPKGYDNMLAELKSKFSKK